MCVWVGVVKGTFQSCFGGRATGRRSVSVAPSGLRGFAAHTHGVAAGEEGDSPPGCSGNLAERDGNLEEVQSYSPGLRGTSYPGINSCRGANPEGIASKARS